MHSNSAPAESGSRARRVVLTGLAVLGVLAALAVTSSSTAEQSSHAGMKGLAVTGLVVLLEVINVSGTWVWLTDTRSHVRIEAAAGVGVASIVTGACGLLSYGLVGLVAPAGLLFAVHLTFRLNQLAKPARTAAPLSHPTVPTELRETSRVSWPSPHILTETIPVAGYQPDPQDEPEVATPLTPEATIPPAVPATPEPVDAGRTEDSTEDGEDTRPVPVLSSVPLGRDDEDVVTALVSRDELPGIGAIASEFGIGKGKATRCKTEAQRRRGVAA